MTLLPPTWPDSLGAELADFYRDLHQHPELSFQEHRTAGRIVTALAGVDGLEVTAGVGGTGVVAVLANGAGPTVWLRADIDALPVAEETGLPYASSERGVDPDGNDVPVMHACGHDMHATCLVGAVRLLAGTRADWAGTVVAVFQPAEELCTGARRMVEDGILDRFPRPEVVLGQHVAPLPAGVIGHGAGPLMAGMDSVRVVVHGRGGHGARPESTIDPVVIAASIVTRLQTIVSREVPPAEAAVVTVGYLRAGAKENIIPAEAELGISIRHYDEGVRQLIRDAIVRIVTAECAAGGCETEPTITFPLSAPVLVSDPDATTRTIAAFGEAFGADRLLAVPTVTASEDVGHFGQAAGVPTVYWFWGGPDRDTVVQALMAGTADRDIPSNHSPHFAPVVEPTLTTGVEALVVAARTWLH